MLVIWFRPYYSLTTLLQRHLTDSLHLDQYIQPSITPQTTFYRHICVYSFAPSILANGIQLVSSTNSAKAVHYKHMMTKRGLLYFLFQLLLLSVASQLRPDRYPVLPKGFWSNISSNSLIHGYHFTFCCHEVSLKVIKKLKPKLSIIVHSTDFIIRCQEVSKLLEIQLDALLISLEPKED